MIPVCRIEGRRRVLKPHRKGWALPWGQDLVVGVDLATLLQRTLGPAVLLASPFEVSFRVQPGWGWRWPGTRRERE